MKVMFAEKDRGKILAAIHDAMGGRKLAEMVHFNLGKGKLEVVISKLGTSTLQFKEHEVASGIEYSLESEKIAFAHKAFKDEVKSKILSVIEKAGGKVLA